MDNWTRKQMNPGTEFRAVDDRLVVKQVDDSRRIGASARPWWAIYIDGQQWGPSHPTATAAMRHAEQPGVAQEIGKQLLANQVPPTVMEEAEPEDVEIARDKVVTEAMEWAERGADTSDLTRLLTAIGALRNQLG